MKIFLCLFLLLVASQATRAQTLPPPLPGLPFDSLTHEPNYHGVVAVPGVSAAELYGRAREWVALTFQDAHQVTQLEDASRGVLIGRGYQRVVVYVNNVGQGASRFISFTFRLDFRDGRYRYELRDLGTRTQVGLLYGTTVESNTSDIRSVGVDGYQWMTSATAALRSSQRQILMGPGTTNNSEDYRSNGTLAKTWPQTSVRMNTALLELLNSLAQYEKTPVAKW